MGRRNAHGTIVTSCTILSLRLLEELRDVLVRKHYHPPVS